MGLVPRREPLLSKNASFVDYVRLSVKGGDGGHGSKSFRREKYIPNGGPDGGDGGKGGDVWIVANKRLLTLLDVNHQPHIRARHGENGLGKNMSGRAGESRTIEVPVGTQISNESGTKTFDLTRHGQRFLAAAGGKGGLGNQHFANAQRQAPRVTIPPGPGEERVLILELKLIADVGLVGLPNAGKSTLLSHLTHATPRVADYPFTTLHPHLGIIEFDDFRKATIADIPGLIEGASQGVGLGDRFLRHVERTALLVHMIAPDASLFVEEELDEQSLIIGAQMCVDSWRMVQAELVAYSEELGAKPQLTALSKIDLLPVTDEFDGREIFLNALRDEGLEPIAISAESGEGLDTLREIIATRLDAMGRLQDALKPDEKEAGSST